MKRQATRRGCPRTKALLTKVWTRCWEEELSQKRIQLWIERIPRHIQKIIELKGGNEYREGREEGEWSDIRPYVAEDRKARYRRRAAGIRPGSSGDDEVS
jgi:hypothetical protein